MPAPVPSLLLVVLAASGAVWLAPPAVPSTEISELSPPPTVAVAKTLSLGRHAAAADLVWMRAAQFIGAPHSERVLYAGLENWVQLASELDPPWETPYFSGSILLATLPGRQLEAAAILVDAEQNLVTDACRNDVSCPRPDFNDPADVRARCVPCPALVAQSCNWRVPLSQGFVSYFGELDAAEAALHFCESRRRGGPEYLTSFSARLAKSGHTCRQLREDLVGLAGESAEGGSEILRGRGEQLRVVLNCEQESLKQAALAYQLRTAEWPDSVQQLLDAGLLEEPPWVPAQGLCWQPGAEEVGFELGRCR